MYFTPVCTTEFIEFSKMYPEFQKRNCDLLGLSVDSSPSHLAWLKNIYDTTGIKVPFSLISDSNMNIAKQYNMLAPNISDTQTIRAVYILDPDQEIKAILQYPKTNGRNIVEILRLLDALQITSAQKVSTPANWNLGKSTIKSSPTTFGELVKKEEEANSTQCTDWYLCYNKRYQPYNLSM